jgi:hypothetical protein
VGAPSTYQPRTTWLEKRLDAELHESHRIRREGRDMEIREQVQELRIARAFARRLSSNLRVVRH